MYQELQIYEESFDSRPIWGTEGNGETLPTLAVGDLFAHETLPALNLRRPPERGEVFAVTGIKHAFRETGVGPEADHLVMVTIALQGSSSRQELEQALDDAEVALENEKQRAAFFSLLAQEQASPAAQKILATVFDTLVNELKTQPAHGIDGDAANQWQEAASILQADGHMLAEMLRSELRGSVSRAFKHLSRVDRIALWIAYENLGECYFPTDQWPRSGEDFDPSEHWHEALDGAEEKLVRRLESALMSYEFPTPTDNEASDRPEG